MMVKICTHILDRINYIRGIGVYPHILDRFNYVYGLFNYLLKEKMEYAVESDVLKYLTLQFFLTAKIAKRFLKEQHLRQGKNEVAYSTSTPNKTLYRIKEVSDGLAFRIPPGYSEVVGSEIKAILMGDQYFSSRVKLKEDQIVIDGGAFIGVFSVIATKIFNVAKVYAFEPEPRNFKLLQDNTRPYADIQPAMIGLYSSQESSKLYLNEYSFAHSLFYKTPRSIQIDLIDLDTFVDKNKLKRVDFIKLDIEGAEPEAILGAKETLFNFKPQLAVSAYHRFNHLFQLSRIIKKINPKYTVTVEKRSYQQMIFAE